MVAGQGPRSVRENLLTRTDGVLPSPLTGGLADGRPDDDHGTGAIADAVLGHRAEEHAGEGRAPSGADHQQAGVGGLGQQRWAGRTLDHALFDRHSRKLRADLGGHLLQGAPGIGLEVGAGAYPAAQRTASRLPVQPSTPTTTTERAGAVIGWSRSRTPSAGLAQDAGAAGAATMW